MDQALLSGTRQQDVRQQAETDAQRIPLNMRKIFFTLCVIVQWKSTITHTE